MILVAKGAAALDDVSVGSPSAHDIAPSQAGRPHQQSMRVTICGVTLTMRPSAAFILLGACSLISAMGFAALQEGAFSIDGFQYGGWMTVITSVCFCVCAGSELVLTGDLERKGSWRDYAILAFLTTTGMYLTNWALNYLNYTTRIVFKSSKVVPTMVVGTLIQGRRYSLGEYVAAGLLILGISLFTLGDVEVNPKFHPAGVCLILMALFADAATSNFEEKRLFRVPTPSSQAEVIFYSSAIATAYGGATVLFTGELFDAFDHSMSNPVVVPLLASAAVCGYFSVTFVLLLIKHFGATNTEIVKSLRKARERRLIFSIALSLLIYPKPLNPKYGAGMIATIVSLFVTYRLKRRKAQQALEAAAALLNPKADPLVVHHLRKVASESLTTPEMPLPQALRAGAGEAGGAPL